MKKCYVPKKFSKTHSAVIDNARSIISEYHNRGILSLTLRQVYYQFVGRDLFPDSRRWIYNTTSRKWVKNINGTTNTQQNYKWLGGILTAAKLAGVIDWNAISDPTRYLKSPASWESPADIIRSCSHQFKVDLWEGQLNRAYVWIEKDAGLSVVAEACKELRTPYMSTRGFSSMQVLHDEAMRHQRLINRGIQPVVILITDHDPSGIAMLTDIENRFAVFEVGTEFNRVALTMDQITHHNLPSDPAKLSDSRGRKYIDLYGEHAYELDALSADVLIDMVSDNIQANILDDSKWLSMKHKEDEQKQTLVSLSDNYDIVEDYLAVYI